MCVLVLALLHRHAATLTRRLVPTLWVVLVAGHYLDVTAPGLYGRDFNLYWDSQHLGNVTAMLARAVPPWLIALGATGFLPPHRHRLAAVARGAAAGGPLGRRGPAARRCAASALIAAFAGVVDAPALTAGVFAHPATGAYPRQARFVLAMAGPGPRGARARGQPGDGCGPGRARGRGRPAGVRRGLRRDHLRQPGLRRGARPSRHDLADAARETGREVLSAYVDSPTFGASSWLAHLSLLTGVEVRDQYTYVAVMSSARDTLPKAFRVRDTAASQ